MPPTFSLLKIGCLALGALTATALLTPLAIRLARKLGAIDHGGYRKINHRNIPRMGGIAVSLPFLSICFMGVFHPGRIFGPGGGQEKDCLILLLGGVMILLLGILDDLHCLSARRKFSFQIAVAFMVLITSQAIGSVQLPFGGILKFSAVSGGLLTILWIVGIINAFNLIDGLDGLATGVASIGAVGLGAIAALNGQTAACLLCLTFAGSLAGFLFFNFHPARCFLGDTGSLFIGFVMAMLALMVPPKGSGALMLAPVLVLGFPIFDTLTSMARRLLRGRNPFSGDRAHTHHRLLDRGFSQRQIALMLYGVAILCTLCAVLLQLSYPRSLWLLLALGCYALVFLVVAGVNGFLRPRHVVRVAQCRERNNRLTSFSRYAALTLRSDAPTLNLRDVLRLGCTVMNLRFLEIATEGYPGIMVTGNHDNGNGETDKPEATEHGETVQIVSAEGIPIAIRYRPLQAPAPLAAVDEHTAETIKLERQDVKACLANAFSGVDLGRLVEVLEADLPGKVREIHEPIVAGEPRLPASALTVD